MMIERLIKEVNICLKNELYMSALMTALTLPDICEKAEFPEYKNGRRYKEWLKKYGYLYFDNLISFDEIYQLRNSTLHQGSPSTKAPNNGIDEFELIIQPYNFTVVSEY